MKNIFKVLFISSMVTFIMSSAWGQDGILFNSEEAQVGYVLTSHDFDTYLLDQCGEIVNEWSISNPDFHVKLDKNGNVFYIKNNRIYERDWDGNIIVEIQHNVPQLELVYDVIKRSNGNYLVNCRWSVNNNDLNNIGWDYGNGFSNQVDGIVELNPEGDVVWSWNIIEHTIQDEVSSASNFGNVEDNPQLMDARAVSDFDWTFGETFMFNGFDYNEELDLILISVRKMSEVIIIDHSTTTAEASGHTGGNYGKGGDVLFRWGNPENYNRDTDSDRYLYYQHNPNWIEYGEHKGGIIIFSNGLSTNMGSSVVIIEPEIDASGQFVMVNEEFSPSTPSRIIKAESFDNRSSNYTSGAKVQENGNVYITIGQWDQFIEVTPDDEIAWNYRLEGSHYTYRTEKYPSNYPGLEGKDLTPNGTIEFFPSPYDCSIFTSTEDATGRILDLTIQQNADQLVITPDFTDRYSVRLLDVTGKVLFYNKEQSGQQSIDLNMRSHQIVFVNIVTEAGDMMTEKVYVR